MIDDQLEQTVSDDANAQAQEPVAAEAQPQETAVQEQEPDLDAILAEFESEQTAAQPQPDPQQAQPETPQVQHEPQAGQKDAYTMALEERLSAMESKAQQFESFQEQQSQKENQTILNSLYNELKADTDADLIDAKSFVFATAEENPKLNDLYEARKTNPAAWKKAFGAMKADFEKRHGLKVDAQATDSRDAVAAAVRGSSTAAPAGDFPEDFQNLSKEEKNKWYIKHGATPV